MDPHADSGAVHVCGRDYAEATGGTDNRKLGGVYGAPGKGPFCEYCERVATSVEVSPQYRTSANAFGTTEIPDHHDFMAEQLPWDKRCTPRSDPTSLDTGAF